MSKAHLPGDPADEPGALALDDLAALAWQAPNAAEPDPTARAGFALSALLDHNLTTTGGNRKETGEDTMRGLIADLLHLADALQLDFDTVVEAARILYRDEV